MIQIYERIKIDGTFSNGSNYGSSLNFHRENSKYLVPRGKEFNGERVVERIDHLVTRGKNDMNRVDNDATRSFPPCNEILRKVES